MVILAKEKNPTVPPIQFGKTVVLSKPKVRYLVIMIERKMSFSSILAT